MERFEREVIAASGERAACALTAETGPPARLEAEIAGIGRFAATGPDLFDALAELRGALAERGLRLLVQGAAAHVYPSSMARQAGGRLAYRCHPGKRASRDDLVDIFAAADPDEIATVAQQKEFFLAWTRSLAA